MHIKLKVVRIRYLTRCRSHAQIEFRARTLLHVCFCTTVQAKLDIHSYLWKEECGDALNTDKVCIYLLLHIGSGTAKRGKNL